MRGGWWILKRAWGSSSAVNGLLEKAAADFCGSPMTLGKGALRKCSSYFSFLLLVKYFCGLATFGVWSAVCPHLFSIKSV